MQVKSHKVDILRGIAILSVRTIARYVSGQTTLMMMPSGQWLITHNYTSFIADNIAMTSVENKKLCYRCMYPK